MGRVPSKRVGRLPEPTRHDEPTFLSFLVTVCRCGGCPHSHRSMCFLDPPVLLIIISEHDRDEDDDDDDDDDDDNDDDDDKMMIR
jgi:hypothetical protein